MSYDRDSIYVSNIKDGIQSKEPKRKVSSPKEEGADKGNFKKKFPQLKKKEIGGKVDVVVAQTSASAFGDSSNERDGSDDLIASIIGSTVTYVMETSASYHMTFKRELFTLFKEWNDSVKLSDDEEFSVKDSGYLHIKMDDGIACYLPGS
ncbi:Retrovirus-related Pol polyprotein from transposon TNT 1-94 [Sesbania bispinosa]|nr:Retrovirus-related Pol polyprotein from transposon TNT 1-94 [Sesbania bispinosa]